MARPEELSHSPEIPNEQGTLPEELSLREQVIRALDAKIMENPFYTGIYSKIWGLSTPIRRNRLDFRFTDGDIPEDFYDQAENSEMSGAPEEVYIETQEDMENQSKISEMGAEEMFEGTTVVLRSPDTISYRKNRPKIVWKARNKNWARNMEVIGEYLGSGSTYDQLVEKYELGFRQRLDKILQEFLKVDMEIKKPNTKSSQTSKPNGLWELRSYLFNPDSEISRLIQDLEKGDKRGDLMLKYSRSLISFYRELSEEFSLPYKITRLSEERQNIHKEFEELDNPDLEFERKKEIMKKIGRYEARLGSELAHVQSLLNLAKASGFFINPRDLKRIGLVLKKEGIFIVKVPSYSNGRIQGYYNYVANGDSEKITNIIQNSGELADLREPSVTVLGKESDKKVNTYDIEFGEYVGVLGTIKRMTGNARNKNFSPDDFLGGDCPVSVYKTRPHKKGGGRDQREYFVEKSDLEKLKDYLKQFKADRLKAI